MIRHIVLFELTEFSSKDEKLEKMNEIKTCLESLVGVVPTLISMEVSFNCNTKEKFDLGLISIFKNMEDLEAYVVHPKHQYVSKNIIQPIMANRACIDSDI